MKTGLLLVLSLLLLSCSEPDTSWYPLAKGYQWQYAVTRSVKGEPRHQKAVQASLGPLNVDGSTLYRKKHPGGQVEYFAREDGGVYRVSPDTGARTLLLREILDVGGKWQAPSRIRFLEVTGAFEATYNRKIKEPMMMTFEVESVDDIVTVPAGRFRNCARIKGNGSLYGGGGSLKEFMAIDTINIETLEWYAPGVGLVKSIRREFTFPLQFENNYLEVLEKIHKG